MTQSQISYFLTVAETLSFSKAAAVLFVSQPAVSKQVSLLEDELGLTLFDRTRQGVFLTQSGHLFQALFQDYIRRFQDTLEEARHINHKFQDVVRIGSAQGLDTVRFIADAQAMFNTKYPNFTLELTNMPADALLPALQEGGIDLMLFSGEPPASMPDLVVCQLHLPHAVTSDGESTINMGWLITGESNPRHLVVNELLFHFKQKAEDERP